MNWHKKIVTIAFLFFVVLVGAPTMARTGYSLGTSFYARLAAASNKTDSQKNVLLSNDSPNVSIPHTEGERERGREGAVHQL